MFYCHKEVLGLSSPFFENVLCGGWRETERLGELKKGKEKGKGKQKMEEEDLQVDGEMDQDNSQRDALVDKIGVKSCSSTLESTSNPVTPTTVHITTSSILSHTSPTQTDSDSEDDDDDLEDDDDEDDDEEEPGIVCRLSLKEERASSFQDLLYHIYPRMECMISWNNVGDLYITFLAQLIQRFITDLLLTTSARCKMADKFDIPSLRNQALAFLLPSAAGNPLLGMKLAEENTLFVALSDHHLPRKNLIVLLSYPMHGLLQS